MKMKYLVPIALFAVAAAFLAAPVLAQPLGLGPKYAKYVASLEDENIVRNGQVIFNTNPEDDGTYELEVEVEECMALADSIVEVKLDGVSIGTIYVDLYGNGKTTFYVTAISTGSTITVVGAITLTSGDWRLWGKIKGPK